MPENEVHVMLLTTGAAGAIFDTVNALVADARLAATAFPGPLVSVDVQLVVKQAAEPNA